ncbi:MAG: hypothetical protein MAG458_01687 [Nitrosopumilus sp.]|nr:hypothetical protein [Nitrosopumilus sp.]
MFMVIAFFIIVAVFIGYNVSQRSVEADAHDVPIEIQSLSQNSESIKILQQIIAYSY